MKKAKSERKSSEVLSRFVTDNATSECCAPNEFDPFLRAGRKGKGELKLIKL
jgi:hypothetical protein